MEFFQDRREALMLMWTFDSPMSRREAKGALESELQANYASELYKGTKSAQSEKDTPIYVNLWQDAQSNLLAVIDAWGQPTLLLIYATAKATGVGPVAPVLPPAKY